MTSDLLLLGKATWHIDVHGVLVVHYSADASHRGINHPLFLVQGSLLQGLRQRAGIWQEAHISNCKVTHTWRATGKSHGERVYTPAARSNTGQFNNI